MLALGLMMVDIDHFKRLDDAFGHQAGDLRLGEVARALAGSTARALDVVARYGGEEFAVILPATHAGDARRLAEQMRLCLASLRLAAPGGHVTISIGVSALEHLVNDDAPSPCWPPLTRRSTTPSTQNLTASPTLGQAHLGA